MNRRRLAMASLALALLPGAASAAEVGTDGASAPVPRRVQIRDREFVLASTGEPIVMVGPNVVVKGPPYIPDVSGTSICNDHVDDDCSKTGSCEACTTFNEADVAHIKQMGWNSLRLGVTWAGAQPRDEDALDPEFLRRLHAFLDLTDREGLHVILDNHGDETGTANCGNGMPMWFQKKAAPELIGKPLTTELPYWLVPELRMSELSGYAACGNNETKWAQFAGDPNYNLLNECCQLINSGNPGNIGYNALAQRSMNYMIGSGRADFVRYWRLLAEAVVGHPSAFAAELMNEPMSIMRRGLYQTWRSVAEAINAVVPDMSVALADTGEGMLFPAWATAIGGEDILLDSATVHWIKESKTLFYAWHWYGLPSDPVAAVKDAQAISKDWNLPTFLTEFMDCRAWRAAAAANISLSYWHYSAYCNTGPAFGNRKTPDATFGACILGWASGDSAKVCSSEAEAVDDVSNSRATIV